MSEAAIAASARSLAKRIIAELARRRPLFVALDGRSGSGKSTLAAAVAAMLEPDTSVVVIDGDDFYAGGSAATWDRRDARQKAEGVIDWRRQRQVLTDLRDHGAATWSAFDWDADDWDADVVPLLAEPVVCQVADVVILEGAYSCRPELAHLVDLRVLLAPPPEVTRAQLLAREGEHYQADWSSRWGEAEAHYFATVMPPEAFDLVIRPSPPTT